MQKIKKPVSILLVFMMIVSLFAAVPMTVNAAPPGGGGGGTGTGTVIEPVHVTAGFATQPYAIEGLVANSSEQALISAGTTADGATAYYYMTTEDITGEQANSLFNSPSKPGSFSTSIPKGTDAGTYYVWYAIDGGSNYEDLLPYMEINNTLITNKLTVTIAAPETFKVYVKKLTGGTFTIENLTGETTVAQLKEIIADQIDIPATAQRLIFAGKTLEDAKTLAEYNIQKESTIHLVIRGYTVTWLNYDNSELGTTTVQYGSTPTYNGETPVRPEDANNTYTFSGWTDGENTYASDALPAVTGDVTYTAVFTYADGVGARLVGYTLSLDGDIGVNFYMELAPEIAQSETAVMHFCIPNGNKTNEIDVPVSEATVSGKYYIFKCNVSAKEMTSVIKAQIIDGETTGTEYTYSVKEYADYLLTNADPEGTDIQQAYADAAPLVIAMLNYGAYAQLYFTPDTDPALLANVGRESDLGGVDGNSVGVYYSFVNDLSDPDIFVGATLSLKSETTVSLYFESESELTFECAGDVIPTVQSGKYQVARIRGIKAKELVKDFTVTVKEDGAEIGLIFYSPMTYCYNVLEQDQPEGLQNVCKALYLYAAAADDYFNEPAPAPVENVVDLGALTGDYEAQDGDVLTGELQGDYQITIAAGATVTLKDVNITCLSNNEETACFAGITLLGDATILIKGTNTVKGGHEYYPGVFVPADKTLTIDGTGSLNASSNGDGCGIGGGHYIAAGNILIKGGTITATGGKQAAGIGSGFGASCGNITINGGTITANGGEDAAGIGSGYDGSCGNITINGGTVTAIGGKDAPGIGGGTDSDCGNITIAGTVTQVTATKGNGAPNSIGAGKYASCGTVTIGDAVVDPITESPYTYPAPAENIVDLGALTGDYEAQDGDVLTGELGNNCNYKITVAAGAEITLRNVTITGLSGYFAGITPLGNATIILEGTNEVKGGYEDYPGIYVPENATLTIGGTGSLDASSNGYGCGIGGGYGIAAGNIVINGGDITATGGNGAAGIGSAYESSCGTITINGGIVTATGKSGAGIGSGKFGSCSDITITDGTITAISGGDYCAGIGSSYVGSCGNITIAATVTQVTATKGEGAPNSIGAGKNGTCGTVTIGGVEGAITESPYTYEP